MEEVPVHTLTVVHVYDLADVDSKFWDYRDEFLPKRGGAYHQLIPAFRLMQRVTDYICKCQKENPKLYSKIAGQANSLMDSLDEIYRKLKYKGVEDVWVDITEDYEL